MKIGKLIAKLKVSHGARIDIIFKCCCFGERINNCHVNNENETKNNRKRRKISCDGMLNLLSALEILEVYFSLVQVDPLSCF